MYDKQKKGKSCIRLEPFITTDFQRNNFSVKAFAKRKKCYANQCRYIKEKEIDRLNEW